VGLAVALVVALLITSLAFLAAMRGPGQRGNVTTESRTATLNATAQATTTADTSTATPTNAAFLAKQRWGHGPARD
jgi:hypothetical protein